MTLGQKITQARKAVGLSQKQLGLLLGVSDKTISSYEVDRSEPSLDQLNKISRATYKHIAFFLASDAEKKQSVAERLAFVEQELHEIKQQLAREDVTKKVGTQ